MRLSLAARLVLLLVFTLVAGAISTRIHVTTDLAAALPHDGESGRAFRDVRRFSLFDSIAIEVDGTGQPPEALHAAVETLGKRLAARDDFVSVRYRYGLQDGIALRKAAAPHLGILVDDVGTRLSPQGMAQALTRARDRMSSPAGALVADGIATDPLDFGGAFADAVVAMNGPGGVTLREGHLISADGQHALILARAKTPALGTMPDSPLLAHLREDLAACPLPADWIGSHRFAAEAASQIQREINRAATAGLGLVALVFLLAFRSVRPIAGALPPLLVGAASASAFAALRSPVHGLALAFGGALAGMGVDYWIHLYLAGVRERVPDDFRGRLRRGEEALEHLLPAYKISVAATLLAFAMLATSSYAAVSDLAWIGIGAVTGAIVSTVLGGPVMFALVARPGDRFPSLPIPERIPGALAAVFLIAVAALGLAGTGVQFDGDPRSLDARLPGTAVVERAFVERYGGGGTTAMVVATAPDLGAALDALEQATAPLASAPGITMRSPLPWIPAPSKQATRRDAVDPSTGSSFVAAAEAAGFDGQALLPGLRATLAATTPPDVATWAGTPGEELLARTIAQDEDGVSVAAIVTAATQEALEHARHEVRLSGSSARFVSPAGIATDGAERIRTELLTRSGLGLLVVFLFMVARYRDVPRVLAAVLPSIAAAAGTMGMLALVGQPLTPVSGPVFVLTLGVAFDQGIFLIEAERESRGAFLASRAAIGIALATALAGFVGLTIATHPAVRSVGLTMSLGIAFTALGAFGIVPAVLTDAGVATSRRWVRRLAFAVAIVFGVDALLAIWGRVRPPPVPDGVREYTLQEASPTDRRYGPNRLVRSHGLWVARIEGTAFELGRAMGMLSSSESVLNERQLVDEFYRHVPNWLVRYVLVRGVPLAAGRMAHAIPVAYTEELEALTAVGPDEWSWLAPRYTRKLCYHAIHDVGQAMVDSPLVACTGFIAGGSRTADGHWLVGRNFDFDGGRFFDEDKAVIVVKRDGAIPFAHVAILGLIGAVSGVNAEGIGVVVLAGASDAPIRAGAPMIFIVREILESARSLEDARAILDRQRGFVSEGLLVVDGDAGQGAVFEVTPDDVTVLPASEAISLSNHFRGDAHRDDDANQLRMAEGTSVARLARMEELVAAEPIDLARAAEILRDRNAAGGRPLPRGNEAAINADIASHGVILDASARTLTVSSYPNLSGAWVRFELGRLLAGDLEGEVVVAPDDPLGALRVHEARRLRETAETQPTSMAEETLERARRYGPGDTLVLTDLARAQRSLGKCDDAKAALLEAKAGPPSRARELRAIEALLAETCVPR